MYSKVMTLPWDIEYDPWSYASRYHVAQLIFPEQPDLWQQFAALYSVSDVPDQSGLDVHLVEVE